jgi:hypothetical protein
MRIFSHRRIQPNERSRVDLNGRAQHCRETRVRRRGCIYDDRIAGELWTPTVNGVNEGTGFAGGSLAFL